ncbi:MAG TPA: HAMP domain-containing sensor histidine kinase [Polyangia bacterium]
MTGPRRSLVSTLLVSAAAGVATLAALFVCAGLAPGASTTTLAVVGGLAATLVVFVLDRLVATRLVWNGVSAVSDGPLGLAEGDYGVRLERVLAASAAIAVIVNEAGHVIHANPPAVAFFGAGKRIDGSLLTELMAAGPPELRDAASAAHDVLFTCERGDADEPETFHLAKHPFEISTRRHTLFILRPLTKELARKEVETWKKAIRVLSHEVDNSLAPITSLIHSARLMLANPAGFQQRLGAALDTIEERATHLKTFLDGYASFARLPLPAKRTVAWKELLGGVEGLYRFKLEGTLPDAPVHADPGQVQQVLINLLKNAAESGSLPDDITLTVAGERGGVEVMVRDRGKGMAPDVLRSVLLPFYSTKKSGSGLGLPLCREIVEAHGGRLALHPRDGGGLVVSCWLPPGA